MEYNTNVSRSSALTHAKGLCVRESRRRKTVDFGLNKVMVPSLVVHQKIVDLLARFDIGDFTFYKLGECVRRRFILESERPFVAKVSAK